MNCNIRSYFDSQALKVGRVGFPGRSVLVFDFIFETQPGTEKALAICAFSVPLGLRALGPGPRARLMIRDGLYRVSFSV